LLLRSKASNDIAARRPDSARLSMIGDLERVERSEASSAGWPSRTRNRSAKIR
jgi:hypothetical protein